jgi:hypothetical protein
MRSVGKGRHALVLAALAALAAGCGDGGTPPSQATTVTAMSATTQSAVVGTAVSAAPSVRVLDQRGNAMQGVAVSFSASAGGTVTSPSAVTDAAGIASAGSWTLGSSPGAQSVTATVASLTPVQFTATAQARVPTTVTATTPTTQTAVAGTVVAQAPTVRVDDQTGQPLAGVAVTFAVTAGNGQVATTTAITSTTGLATASSWTLGAAGQNTVSATVAGLAAVQFNATAQARVPTTVTAVSVTQQSAAAGTAVPQPPSVRVNDQTGQPLAGVAVTFAVTGGGGVVTGGAATTSAAGVATVGSWTLGAAAGQNTLTATVAGLPPVTFTATATAAADPCSTAVTYTPGATVSGSLSSTDCRLSTGEYVDVYATRLPTAQAIAFNMSSSAVDSWLALYDANGNIAALNDDATENVANSSVRVFAPSGDYLLAASSYSAGETGAYTLSSAALTGNVNCDEYWVVPGVAIAGSLTTSDCNFSGFYADEYLVVMRPGQTLTVRMESTAVDAFLELYSLTGALVASNDNGAGGKNALLSYTYNGSGVTVIFIDATTLGAGETGTYTLTVARN